MVSMTPFKTHCYKMQEYYDSPKYSSDKKKQLILAIVMTIVAAAALSTASYFLVTGLKRMIEVRPCISIIGTLKFALSATIGIPASGGLIYFATVCWVNYAQGNYKSFFVKALAAEEPSQMPKWVKFKPYEQLFPGRFAFFLTPDERRSAAGI